MVTGLRPDIVGWTADWRTRGRRLPFDPADTTDPPPGFERVRWTPLVGCTGELTALQRANALFAGRPNPSGDEAYWRQEGRNVPCAYLLAAARADLTMRQVVEWANRSDDTEPVAVLPQLDDSGLWSNSLRAAIANEPRHKAGVHFLRDTLPTIGHRHPQRREATTPTTVNAASVLADHTAVISWLPDRVFVHDQATRGWVGCRS